MLFELHFFLWFAALTPVYGYMSVYATKYANVSTRVYGLLTMILPFMSIIVKPIFCSLADRYRAHKAFFIAFLSLTLIGYGNLGILPFFIDIPPEEEGLNIKTWAFICFMSMLVEFSMSIMTSLSDSFAMNQAHRQDKTYGSIRVWGTLGWGACAFCLAFANGYKDLPPLVPGLLMTIALLITDIIIVVLWKDQTKFELYHQQSNEKKNIPTINRIEEDDTVEMKILPSHNEEVKDKGLVPGQLVGYSKYHLEAKEKPYKNSCKYEVPPIAIAIENPKTTTTCEKSGTRQADKKISFKLQWLMLTMVMERRKSLFRYLVLFIIAGALSSLQWIYFFLYQEKIYESDFTYISGLSMVGQSILGELPFFIISHKLIELVGRSSALSFSIISIGIRYLLYAYLLPNVNMYFILLSETLQGPAFGLFYVVMTDVGMDYSNCDDIITILVDSKQISDDKEEIDVIRKALAATMQGLVSACYEGIGASIGSLIGGLVIYSYGFSQLWVGAAVIAISAGMINMLLDRLVGLSQSSIRLDSTRL